LDNPHGDDDDDDDDDCIVYPLFKISVDFVGLKTRATQFWLQPTPARRDGENEFTYLLTYQTSPLFVTLISRLSTVTP